MHRVSSGSEPVCSNLKGIRRSGFIRGVKIGVPIAKRWLVVCGVLLVAAGGLWMWWRPWESREPVYDGKPMSYWLTNGIRLVGTDTDNGTSISVVQVVGVDGRRDWSAQLLRDSNAVPFLVRTLKRDKWLGAAIYRKQVWPRFPDYLPFPPVKNSSAQIVAAHFLGQMGSMAKPAVPSLIRVLKEDEEPTIRMKAARALGNIGKGDSNVTAALTGAVLKDRDWGVRQTATNALLELDPEAAAKARTKVPSS
jgi:hypothetical protein